MIRRTRAIAVPMKKDWRCWGSMVLAALLGLGCQPDDPKVRQTPNLALANVADAKLTRSPEGSLGIAPTDNLEVVALFDKGPMPTGVAVSDNGRVFVNFPRWGDPVEFTVAEIVDGQARAYPNLAYNRLQKDKAESSLVSVQSVVVDPTGRRLWLLDTGSINFGKRVPGGAKLIGVDLQTDRIVKEIVFPDTVALPTTYLNDVRFDMTRGREGTAYITDSSAFGDSAIIVVDLATGNSLRRLHRHPSVMADEQFVPRVEGEPLKARVPGQPEAFLKIGADGIAISPDGKTLYYCPLASRRWYSVSTEALADAATTDAQIAATVKPMPARDFASDGLESDAAGRLYLTDYEHNAIRRFTPGGSTFETIAAHPALIWPDTLSMARDGHLYVTANQLNRQASYQDGTDERQRPFVLFRVKTDGQAIRSNMTR